MLRDQRRELKERPASAAGPATPERSHSFPNAGGCFLRESTPTGANLTYPIDMDSTPCQDRLGYHLEAYGSHLV
jgi:hypothetical protein